MIQEIAGSSPVVPPMSTVIALENIINYEDQDDDGLVHYYDSDEYPWAYCGAFIGYADDAESSEVNCPTCLAEEALDA